MKLRGIAIGVVAALALTFTTGCSGASSSRAPMEGPAMPEATAPAGGGGGNDSVEPQIVRTATMRLTVPQLEPAVAALAQIAHQHGGSVSSETSDYGATPPQQARVVLRVDAAALDDTLTQITALGTVESREITSDDVTAEVADIAARLRNLDASIERLKELMKRADKVSDLAAIEEQLTQRQGERDSLAAQQKALEGRVAQSTVTVSLSGPGGSPQLSGFLPGLATGWSALVETTIMAVTALGVLTPFLAVIGVVLAPVLWIRARRRRKAAAPHAATSVTSPDETP